MSRAKMQVYPRYGASGNLHTVRAFGGIVHFSRSKHEAVSVSMDMEPDLILLG